ncbi:hypothetical protein HDU97_007643 [Phlyctochytrium planicorne]|nr:hypothetical protein HDU97_007643 [Phlyctochytrium planicorne]
MTNEETLPECCRTGFLWNGTPVGETTKIAGVDAYISKPSINTDKWVVIWSDVFGYKMPNVQLIADSIAKAGFNCVVPDLFNNDPLPYTLLEPIGRRTKTIFDRISQTFHTLYVAPTFISWIRRHTDAHTLPIVNAVLEDIKQTQKASKIGVVGYCYGGRSAVLNGNPDEKRVDCFVAVHPSRLAIPKDVEAVGKPGLFICGSEDFAIPPATIEVIKGVAARVEKDISVKVYERMLHGFAVRGNEDEEETRKARDGATNDTVAFLVKHL